ncbi:hypothetical protein DJ71_26430 [Halorubrum sp. E3]|uniref:Uncharacterized protein n=1 Tax=Halorubrum persicum TaxID=1383844 RepID=A0A2G1WH90_9EURY|nr:hypothetical protein DJ71_26430 [Halorubrum sp. E3]PHQ38368.1 hypothetical protein DJ69_12025 [Halorubrum persicum]
MVRLTRRKTLQTGGSVIVAGLAGCSAFDRDASPALTLGEIEVANLDFRPHTVSVAILDDEEPVYWAEMDISAAEPETDNSSSVATAGDGSFEGFPAEVGQSLLYAWRDNQSTSKWEMLDFGEVDASCIGLEIQIGDIEQSRTGDVSIWYTTDPHACENADNRD